MDIECLSNRLCVYWFSSLMGRLISGIAVAIELEDCLSME